MFLRSLFSQDKYLTTATIDEASLVEAITDAYKTETTQQLLQDKGWTNPEAAMKNLGQSIGKSGQLKNPKDWGLPVDDEAPWSGVPSSRIRRLPG